MEDVRIFGRKLSEFTYAQAPGHWAITSYYNPMGYKSRRVNYEIFAALMRRSGIPLLTVECAFNDQPYDLPEQLDVVRVRSQSPIWQKERLLNLAISWLPSACRSVSWHDCDMVYLNKNWAQETVELLEHVGVVQLFQTCNRLPQNFADGVDMRDLCTSFTEVVGKNPEVLKTNCYYDHGHPGYAWAARRDILDRHGLYEHAIVGSADHCMAHAAVGDYYSECAHRPMHKQPRLVEHFYEWAKPFADSVGGRIGTVSGEAMHLWHGDLAHRKYLMRHLEFAEFGVNPFTDIIAIPGRPLELRNNGRNAAVIKWFNEYFVDRREDGIQVEDAIQVAV